jgi:hypothetical protein
MQAVVMFLVVPIGNMSYLLMCGGEVQMEVIRFKLDE